MPLPKPPPLPAGPKPGLPPPPMPPPLPAGPGPAGELLVHPVGPECCGACFTHQQQKKQQAHGLSVLAAAHRQKNPEQAPVIAVT